LISITPSHSFSYNNTTLNVYHAEKGEGLPKHQHQFSHASLCTIGSIIVRKEGKELIMDKNSQPVDLPANEWHEVEALEDGTVFINIFAEENQYNE
jgi:quercetin dioxygenase-like cupin family protein